MKSPQCTPYSLRSFQWYGTWQGALWCDLWRFKHNDKNKTNKQINFLNREYYNNVELTLKGQHLKVVTVGKRR